MTVIELKGKNQTRHEHFGLALPKFSKNLQTWGEVGTVTTKTKMTPKFSIRGEQCVFINYSPKHGADTYKMKNPSTKRCTHSRDVAWIKRMCFPKTTVLTEYAVEVLDQDRPQVRTQDVHNEDEEEIEAPTPDSDKEDREQDDGEEQEQDEDNDEEEEVNGNAGVVTTRSGHVSRRTGAHLQPLDDAHKFNNLSLLDSCCRQSSPAEQKHCKALDKHLAHDDAAVVKMACTSLAKQKLGDDTSTGKAAKGLCVDLALVGAGIGGRFTDTAELKPMNHKEAVKKDPVVWGKAFK